MAQNFNISNQVTFGGDKEDYINSIIHTKDNGILVAGPTYSGATDDKTDTSRGSYDYLVVKYDLDYNELWQKTIGGDASDYLFDAIELSDGSYLLGGYSASEISGDKTIVPIGGIDYWVVKLSPTGDIIWQNVYGGEGGDLVNSMLELNDGSIILCGTSSSNTSGTKTEDSKGGYDYWIVKIDANGNQIWDKTIGSSAYDKYPEIVKDNNEDLYIVGYTTGNISGDKTENNYDNSQDIWVVKIDTDGNILWDKTIGSNETEYTALAVYNSGYIYIASKSDGEIGGLKTEPNYNSTGGYTDIWLIKMDLQGNIIWDKTIGGTRGDLPSSISVIDDATLLLCNNSGSETSGDKSEDNIGWGDHWLVKIDTSGQIIWDKTIGGLEEDWAAQAIVVNENQFIIGGNSKSGISGDKTDYCRGEEDFWIYTLDVSQDILEYPTASNFRIYPNPANDYLIFKNNSLKVKKGKIIDLTNKIVKQFTIETSDTKISIDDLSKGIYLVKIGNQTNKLIIQ